MVCHGDHWKLKKMVFRIFDVFGHRCCSKSDGSNSDRKPMERDRLFMCKTLQNVGEVSRKMVGPSHVIKHVDENDGSDTNVLSNVQCS